MEKVDFLEKMGFTTTEARVYMTLLDRGALSVSELSRITHMHRPALYKILPMMQEKGFVSVMPKGKYKLFIAESPKKLEKIYADLQEEYTKQMAELEGIYAAKKATPRIKVYEGHKEVEEVFMDIVTSLKKGDIFYRYSSQKVSTYKFLPKRFQDIRDKKQLERLVITSEAKMKAKSNKMEREIRIVPPDYDLFEDNVSQIIYGDKVAVIDYNTTTAYVVENETVAKFQEKIFKLLYRKLA